MRSLRPFAAPLLAVLLISGGASADVPDADRATARALAVEGQDALDRKDFTTAADRFARADALIHAPSLLLGVARAQVGLGKLVSAEETYRRILREGAPPGAPPAFVRALADARTELAALLPRLAYVTIQVEGAPDAAVTLDGEPVPGVALGAKRPVDPGKHVVRAVAGRAVGEATVELGEGGAEIVTLVPRAPGERGGPSAPLLASSAAPPVAASGASPLKTAGIVALGVGGLTVALGAAAGVAALVQHNNLANQCLNGVCPHTYQAAVDSFHLSETLSTVGVVVGGAAMATGVVLFLVAPKPRARDAALAPLLGPGFVGLGGRFQ